MRSIIQDEKKCWVCGCKGYLEDHHIFGGNGNRKLSEKYGLKVWLCMKHHTGSEGVHSDEYLMMLLHRVGQQAFEKTHTRQEFMDTFLVGNYLGGE